MRLSKILISAIFLPALLGLTGCDSSATSVLQLSGHYDGTVTLAVQTNNANYKPFQQIPVGTDVNIDGSSPQSTITMKDSIGNTILMLNLTDFSDNSVTLQSSAGMPSTLKLTIDPVSQCYLGSDSAVKVTLCTANLEISLEIQNVNSKDGSDLVSAIVYRANSVLSPVVETPTAYTLKGAIARARAASFTSRIEFEHVVQAKLNAKAAYLHLLPQLSIGIVQNGITAAPFAFTGVWQTLLMGIGDLVPFLLPDRWLQADAANKQYKAQQDTQILMRLDMGVQVEGLFYAYQRDKNTLALTQKVLDVLTEPKTGLRDQVSNREAHGVLPKTSTAPINVMIDQLQGSVDALKQLTTEDLATISLTLGYVHPDTVTDATVPAFDSLDSLPDTLDKDALFKQALKVSFEYEQFNDLIAAAVDNKDAAPWTFLDPYGDPSLFLSFALPSQIGVLQSQVDELKIDQEQIEGVLGQKVGNAVADYTAAVSGYKHAKSALAHQNDILDDALGDMAHGIAVDYIGLVNAYQQTLGVQIGFEAAVASYGVAQAEVSRLLLQGNYAGF